MRYLIGYDIADPKRLQRIYRRIIKFATPLQYSVFIFEGTKTSLNANLKNVLHLLNNQEDDLRIYALPEKSPFKALGKPVMPEGIVWGALIF